MTHSNPQFDESDEAHEIEFYVDNVLKSKTLEVRNSSSFFEMLATETGGDFSSLAKFFRTNLFFLNGTKHLDLKRQLKAYYMPARVRMFKPELDTIVKQTIHRVASSEHCDLFKLSGEIALRASYAYLGLTDEYHSELGNHIEKVKPILVVGLPRKIKDYMAIERSAKALYDLVQQCQSENPWKNERGESFVKFHAAKGLSIDNIYSYQVSYLVAGMTTGATLANVFQNVLNLTDNKRQDLINKYGIERMLDEMLYFSGGVEQLHRQVTAEKDAQHYRLNKGDIVVADIREANEEKAGGCPFAREGNNNLNHSFTFGKGLHRCIGEAFSLQMMSSTLEQFFEAFPKAKITSSSSPHFAFTRENDYLNCCLT